MQSSTKASADKAPSRFLNTFRVSKNTDVGRKRARFGPQRRQEVKAVRHRRACLRCSLLKIKCSNDDRCTTCAQLVSALHTHEKQVLGFSGCIRTRLSEVSIFELYLPSSGTHSTIMEQSKSLALAAISLTFASEVTWDLEVLVNDVLTWLNGPSISNISKVGILSSPKLSELLDSSLGKLVAPNFQRMIYATSLAYTNPVEPPLPTEVIHNIGCIAGHELLKSLDEDLKPQSLKECSVNDIRALFLLAFGTIIAVGYCQPMKNDATPFSSDNARDMQSHLCQILAHYMVYLGSRLGLPITRGVDQFILEAAPLMWHKKGIFDWITPEDSDGSEDIDENDGESFVDSGSGVEGTILSDVQSSPHAPEERRVPENSYNDEKPIPVYGLDVSQNWWTNPTGLHTLLVPEESISLSTERDVPETMLRSESQISWDGLFDTFDAIRTGMEADSSHPSMTKTPQRTMYVCQFHQKDPNFFRSSTVRGSGHTNTPGFRYRTVDDLGDANAALQEHCNPLPYTMRTTLEPQDTNIFVPSRTQPIHMDERENKDRRKETRRKPVAAQRHLGACAKCDRNRRACRTVSRFCPEACQRGPSIVPVGIQFNFESWLKNHSPFEDLSPVLRERYIAYIAKQGVVTALIPAGEIFNHHPDMEFLHQNTVDEECWNELRQPRNRLLV